MLRNPKTHVNQTNDLQVNIFKVLIFLKSNHPNDFVKKMYFAQL